MKVQNMTGRNGNKVANQFILYDDKGNSFFQSYKTIIAKINRKGETTLNLCWSHSKTTSKYRNQFLGESKKETELKIKSGEYKLVNLN